MNENHAKYDFGDFNAWISRVICRKEHFLSETCNNRSKLTFKHEILVFGQILVNPDQPGGGAPFSNLSQH